MKYTNEFGHKIALLRNSTSGGYQGYVGIPKSHVLYGKNYQDHIPEYDQEEGATFDELVENKGILFLFAEAANQADLEGFISLGMQFSVHGGITYASGNYWDEREEISEYTPELNKYIKVRKLRWYCGDDLFSYYYERIDRETHRLMHVGEQWQIDQELEHNPMFRRAYRVHQVSQQLKAYPKPKIEGLEDHQWEERDGKIFFTEDDYWYFGWDCVHYGDSASEFTIERAKEETDALSLQLFLYDNEEVRYYMGELKK